MAVDGKNASGRLAAATVLWLLVAIFANQDYVYCQGEQQQQQQQQQQFQPPPQQPQQQPPPTQFQPPPQQQQQQQQQPPPTQFPQQLPPPPQSQPPPQMPQPQMPQPQPQRPPNQPQNLQQQRPINQQVDLPQTLGILGPTMNNNGNDMQPNLNRLPSQSNNPDFGSIPITQLQQTLSNVGAPSDMLGGGRIPSFSGGPSQAPSFNENNLSQGMNPQFPSNSPFESNPNPNPNPQAGQNQWRPPPPRVNEPMNKAQGSMINLQQKYPEQNMQQRPNMNSVLSHIQNPQNSNFGPPRGPQMGQQNQAQVPRPYQPQFSFNGNPDNMYEIPVSTNPPAGFPGESLTNLNFGDLMRPTQMFTNMMPENALDLVQKPVGMFLSSVDRLGKYGGGVKEGLTNVLRDVVTKIFDQGQSGAHRVFDMGLQGTNAAIDFGRRILIPDFKNPQVADSGGRYNTLPNNGYNNNRPPPTSVGYGTQSQAGPAGQFAGGNGNGQMSPAQQTEYPQQRTGPNYGSNNNPINNPQPIVIY